MAASTGPILATGAVSLFISTAIRHSTPEEQIRVVVATGIAAVGLGLIEQAAPRLAVALAWTAFITSWFVPGPSGITPFEVIEHWYREK